MVSKKIFSETEQKAGCVESDKKAKKTVNLRKNWKTPHSLLKTARILRRKKDYKRDLLSLNLSYY